MKKSLLPALFLLTALLAAGCARTAGVPDIPEAPDISVPNEPSPAPAAPETPDAPEAPPPESESLVRVRDYIPDLAVDLRYATADNFTGTIIYDYRDAYLRYGTVQKLAKAQQKLYEAGYVLLIWDAFRSAAAQDALWAAFPDGNYVANPANGYSGHTRGDTVDLTLLTSEGAEVPMPSAFDDFSALADRDYSDVSESAAENATLLERVMTECGFVGYDKEWWHYSDSNRYEPALDFMPPEE